MTEQDRGELLLYLGLGQSLLALIPRLRPLGEGTGFLDEARAWVFAAEGDPRPSRDPEEDLPKAALDELYPHQRFGRSGPMTAASAEILRALGLQDQLLTVNLAKKNARLEAFLPPNAIFRNVERCLQRTADIARKKGLRFDRLVVSLVQGQADARTPHKVYLQQLAILVDALDAAVVRVTGKAGGMIFCLSQVTPTYDVGRRGASLAQVEFAQGRRGQVVLAGPDYMLERSDGVHLKPRSAVRLGVLHGRALKRALSGVERGGLQMVAATVAGQKVTVTFAGGTGELEVAEVPEGPVEVGVRPLPMLGFVWHAAREPETAIAAAEITGPRTVTLTLSRPPESLARTSLTLGFPGLISSPEGFVSGDPATARGGATGLRCATRDPGPFGMPLHDWALLGQIAPRWNTLD